MTETITPALFFEALYTKSQVYIGKGLRAKGEGDFEEYQLWASLALELLGKAALSGIHPSLIADPTHYQSLFAACGKPISPDVKTITAKTLFSRLFHVSKKFDSKIQTFCEQMALRRNSEIHSGESPFSGMKADSWERQYWYAVEIILLIQEKELEEWLGAEDSEYPKKILEDAKNAIQMAVQQRILSTKEDFETKYKSLKKRKEIIAKSKTISPLKYFHVFNDGAEGFELNNCPSCNSKGILGGELWNEEIIEESEYDPYVEFIEKIYGTEEFFCPTCSLHLNGARELEVTKLPEEFSVEEEREREFEEDYGND